MKLRSIYERCPMCGGFWNLTYLKVWGELRLDCNKCGFTMRGESTIQQNRYLEILQGKTLEEKHEIASRT